MRRWSTIVLMVAIIAAVVGYSGTAARDRHAVLNASNVIGMKVQGTDGKNVGKINDVIINSDGEIVYALLDIGGFWGTAEKYVAVPADALHTSDNGQKIALETTKSEMIEVATPPEDTRGTS